MDVSRKELKTIADIADRAVQLYERLGVLSDNADLRFARGGIVYEVLTVHTQIIPLRLDEMLEADDGNFGHDIAGIHRHLEDGKKPRLTDGFCPRFAVV